MKKYRIPLGMMGLIMQLFMAGCGSTSQTPQTGQPPSATPAASSTQLQRATALSNHYVEVQFAAPAGAAAAQGDMYSITGPDGNPLAIQAVQMSSDRSMAVLSTDAQDTVTYTLTMMDTGREAALLPAPRPPRQMATRVLSAAVTAASTLAVVSPAEAAPANSTTSHVITFEGSSTPEPFVQTAIALSNTRVLLTFSERMNAADAGNPAFYRIVAADSQTPANDAGDLVITSAVLSADELTVELTTSTQRDIEYTVIVTNLRSRASTNARINPFRNTTTFFGLPTVDTAGPRLLSAVSTSNTTVQLDFNEPLGEAAANPLHFTLCAAAFVPNTLACPTGAQLAITDAQLSTQNTQVVLTTLPQVGGVEYHVRVENVTDRATPAPGNLLTPNPSVASFKGTGQGAPALLSAIALDNTTVLLTFSERMDDSVLNAAFYRIAAPDLTIASVAREDTMKVRLRTSTQTNVDYTVRATNVRSQEGFLVDAHRNSATFAGIALADTTPPQLLSAATTSSTTVLLSFSEALADTAADAIHFVICAVNATPCPAASQLVITATQLTAAKTQVVLTTLAQQPGVEYTVFVNNVYDRATPPPGNVIEPGMRSATFGLLLDDQTAPALTSAVSTSSTMVQLTFSEPLADNAAVPSHFVICAVPQEPCPSAQRLVITDAQLSGANTQVILTTLPQTPGVVYTVVVANVTDPAGNGLLLPPPDPNAPGTNPGTLTAPPPARIDDSSVPPRVVGAASTSNTTVMVTFSKAMGASAITASNYVIVQENVNSEVGVLLVTGASFPDAVDHSVVQLTTRSQNEVTYRVTAVNVRDEAGNQLAPKEFLAGVRSLQDPTSATFPGTPPSGAQFVDRDVPSGDGLSDNAEQQGWLVTVRLADGTIVTRQVTSDPDNPDTDGDGIPDKDEKTFLADPRNPDTDEDGLTDFQELNEIYSDPHSQDTDGDGLPDGLEFNFFKTSPILADTDGDQIPDGVEITLANRNPRVADLPSPTVEVGEVRLGLDVRFTQTTSTETRQLQTKNITSNLTQSTETTTANSSSNTQEAMAKLAVGTEFTIEAGFPNTSSKFETSVEAETGWTGSWTHESSTESSLATQREYATSLTTEAETTEGVTVTREVFGASLQATVLLRNPSNLAYKVRNLQVTVFILDPQQPSRLIPVATLVPDPVEPAEGFALGPLQRERGPLIFSNTTIFPSLVEALMKNPRGLVFRISNFDILDEFGRNFAFTSQAIIDRTGLLVIDNGSFDGNGDGVGDLTQYFRVATSTGRVVASSGSPRRRVFDAEGKQVGITLPEALQAIGLTRYDEATTPTASLSDADQEASYSTIIDPQGVERIFRIRKAAHEAGKPKNWEVITAKGIDQTVGLDNFILKTEGDLKLAFVQDLDQDRLESRLEYIYGCSDLQVDTDGDGLDDRFETLIGWAIDVTPGGTKQVFASCKLTDTDRDGLSDDEEFDRGTDPTSVDTDGDGISDADEVHGYQVTLLSDCPHNASKPGTLTVMTAPTRADTDGDGASDGIEQMLGGDPTDAGDRDCFGDDDGDGLPNIQETLGWDIVVEGVSTSPPICDTVCAAGPPTTMHVTSDPLNPDTDGDGLSDREEFDLKTDPTKADTDGDHIPDFVEVRGFILRDQGVITTDPTDADTDNDKQSDGAEAGVAPQTESQRWVVRVLGKNPYPVFSDPLQADADFDRLADGDERQAGTDPSNPNTDEDARDDGVEVRTGTNPLARDFKVTVGFRDLMVMEDCDDPASQAGDFFFNLGIERPDGSFVLAVTSSPSQSTSILPPNGNCRDPGGPAGSDALDDNQCRRVDSPSLIQVQSGSTLPLGDRSVTIGVTVNDVFAIAGEICEIDGGCDTDGGFPFVLDDPFPHLAWNGSMDPRSAFFSGDELTNGTFTGTFKKPAGPGKGCQIELRVFMQVSGK